MQYTHHNLKYWILYPAIAGLFAGLGHYLFYHFSRHHPPRIKPQLNYIGIDIQTNIKTEWYNNPFVV